MLWFVVIALGISTGVFRGLAFYWRRRCLETEKAAKDLMVAIDKLEVKFNRIYGGNSNETRQSN